MIYIRPIHQFQARLKQLEADEEHARLGASSPTAPNYLS